MDNFFSLSSFLIPSIREPLESFYRQILLTTALTFVNTTVHETKRNGKYLVYLNTKNHYHAIQTYFTKATNACLVAQSCLTLCNPMDYSPPGSSVRGILQARILEIT